MNFRCAQRDNNNPFVPNLCHNIKFLANSYLNQTVNRKGFSLYEEWLTLSQCHVNILVNSIILYTENTILRSVTPLL